ncbi:MAG: 50S ribosomal protein L10 [Bacteroidetes bacterium]|nr:50S ribosomal protein L10 [Bacteroidota bacterium]MDA1119512.1 50S ribosomal protein L10 [Bacteroidota bacterium]
MIREQKGKIIDALAEKLANTSYFYLTDASGLSVAQVNAFRQMCYDKGVEYQVVKNTLIKKALEKQDADYSELDEALKGFSGILFSQESGKLPAGIIKQFHKTDKEGRPKLKAASIESALYIGGEHLNALSELKSKNELIGEIIGLLQSPVNNVLSALLSGRNKLAGIVKTLSERE